MADQDSPTPRPERLPIKLVLPKQGTERKIKPGGEPPRPFRTVDDDYRRSLSNQVSAIRHAIVPQVRRTGAAPVCVKLLAKAAAKSHRPEQLFSQSSCPIIGAGRLGEVFVKATPEGLERLITIIESVKTDRVTKELSCVEAIEPVTPLFRRGNLEPNEVLRRSPRRRGGFMTRVRLFNFGPDKDQPRLVEDFQETCRARNIQVSQDGYSLTSFTYATECRSAEDVDALSRVVGVRSISHMPLIRTIRAQNFSPLPLPTLLTRQEVTGDVPVVVVVDSGVSDQIPALESWVFGRHSDVAPEYRNTTHGTFVAGLICWGRTLNPTIPGLDESLCGVFDF